MKPIPTHNSRASRPWEAQAKWNMDCIAGERTFQKMTFPAQMAQQMCAVIASSEKKYLAVKQPFDRTEGSLFSGETLEKWLILLPFTSVKALPGFVLAARKCGQNHTVNCLFHTYICYLISYRRCTVFFLGRCLVRNVLGTDNASGIVIMSVASSNL